MPVKGVWLPPRLRRRPSFIASLVNMWSGRLEQAHLGLTRLRRELDERGAESELVFVAFQLETLECWRGDFVEARSIANQAYERANQIGTKVPLALALSARAHSSAYAGDVIEARNLAEASVDLFRRAQLAVVSLVPSATLGFIDLSLDDFERAAQRLAPMAAGALALGIHEPALVPFAPDAAEALVRVGRLKEAGELVDWLEENGRRNDRAWAIAAAGRCRSLLHASQGKLDLAVRCCEQAVLDHGRVPMPFERARTLLVLGQLQRRSGKRRAAQASLLDAHQAFAAMGAMLWAKKALRELRGIGMRPERSGGLTPSEQRVAELAASGRTNRQVAAALMVSPKTVEANLVRIYQKLQIHSRAELGRRMSEPHSSPSEPRVAGEATETALQGGGFSLLSRPRLIVTHSGAEGAE